MSQFDGLEVPGPTITQTSEPFWTALADGRLRLQRCGSCEQWVFYPREICPHCWSPDLAWHDASGRGRITTFSDVVRPGHPGWTSAAPYTVLIIELEEGPTMLSLLAPTRVPAVIGAPVTFTPTEIGGRMLPTFSLDLEQQQKESVK